MADVDWGTWVILGGLAAFLLAMAMLQDWLEAKR